MPMKILTDTAWVDALTGVVDKGRTMGKDVVLHTHFNSPNEITEITRQAMNLLFGRGITVRNQSVLIRGVNDDPHTMTLLTKRLSWVNVHPYYVYMHDLVKGAKSCARRFRPRSTGEVRPRHDRRLQHAAVHLRRPRAAAASATSTRTTTTTARTASPSTARPASSRDSRSSTRPDRHARARRPSALGRPGAAGRDDPRSRRPSRRKGRRPYIGQEGEPLFRYNSRIWSIIDSKKIKAYMTTEATERHGQAYLASLLFPRQPSAEEFEALDIPPSSADC